MITVSDIADPILEFVCKLYGITVEVLKTSDENLDKQFAAYLENYSEPMRISQNKYFSAISRRRKQ